MSQKGLLGLATVLALAGGTLIAAPREEPRGGSVFSGERRCRETVVPSAGLRVFAARTMGGGPVGLMLLIDNGTPSDPSDDIMVFCVGEEILADPSVIGKKGRVVLEACHLADPTRHFAIMRMWDAGLGDSTVTRCTM